MRTINSTVGLITTVALAAIVVAGGVQRAPAQELEIGKIRLGGDYETVEVPDAEGCLAACDGDPRCLSFTYIANRDGAGGQCRLKNTVAPAYDNRCCTSGVRSSETTQAARDDDVGDDAPDTSDSAATRPSAAYDGDPAMVCAYYAAMATAQNETNAKYQCGLDGELWSDRAGRHRRFCHDATPDERRQAFDEREASLSDCLTQRAAADALQNSETSEQ